MPNKLSIRIETVPTADPNVPQTVSKFVVENGDNVWFENQASQDATVTFAGQSPLCKGGQSQNPITVKPGKNNTEKLKVCVDGGEFKYTASVPGANDEDPILVIEKPLTITPTVTKNPIVFPEDWIPLLVGAVIGLVIGLLVGRRRIARPT